VSPLAALARLGVRALDGILRRAYGVHPFTEEPACILRISFGPSPGAVRLRDGTRIRRGDPIIHLHLWNERLLALPRERSSLGWGRSLLQQAAHSLQLLAHHLHSGPGSSAVAVRGELGFVTQLRSIRPALERLGFDVRLKEAPGWRVWRRACWGTVYSVPRLWACGAHSLRGRELGELRRVEAWMSGAELLARLGGGAGRASSQSVGRGVS